MNTVDKKTIENFREPMNTLTHLIGLILSVMGTFILMITSIKSGDLINIAGGLVFGISMILLYLASTIYHGFNGSRKQIIKLKRFDYAMIFVLIAGSYTPICMSILADQGGLILLLIVWLIALAGVAINIINIKLPRWVRTGLYLGLGWAAIFMIYPLYLTLPLTGFVLMVLGGVFYSIGGVIYGIKSSRLQWGRFGFHEIFHVFILLGTLSHFIMINTYVVV